jgi:hypothetical protein
MTLPLRPRTHRWPVSVPMSEHEIETVDRAAALRGEPRAAYIRRIATQRAAAELRAADRRATESSSQGAR